MKNPVIHIRTQGELALFVHWAAANGYYPSDLPKAASAIQCFSVIDGFMQPDGIDLYVDRNHVYWRIKHPVGITHQALTHVNSLSHLKAYLKRMEAE